MRFKLRLGIGEDAYKSLKVKKTLQAWWDVGGMAATGAGVAASQTVASTFFASTATGGLLSIIGLGTAAATPIGWVVGAAVVSGGAYYGVSRLFGGFAGSRVEVIPKFINTPMDLLGASLLDLLGSLAVRVALIDGHFDESEREIIVDHFVLDWGFERAYVDKALGVITAGAPAQRLEDIAGTVARFLADNPDCNPTAIHAALIAVLRDIAEADGVLDDREDLAIEAIDRVLREAFAFSLRSVGRSLGALSDKATTTVREVATWAASRKGGTVT